MQVHYSCQYAVKYFVNPTMDVVAVPTFSLSHLRCLNASGLVAIYSTVNLLLRSMYKVDGDEENGESKVQQRHGWTALDHLSMNICLFPPLLFFCSLYYTDVVSVLLVLGTYLAFRRRSSLRTVLIGMASLTLRQTNVFWVGIYLTGLEVLEFLKKGRKGSEFSEAVSFRDVIVVSWKQGCLYDPLSEDAWFEGIAPFRRTCV